MVVVNGHCHFLKPLVCHFQENVMALASTSKALSCLIILFFLAPLGLWMLIMLELQLSFLLLSICCEMTYHPCIELILHVSLLLIFCTLDMNQLLWWLILCNIFMPAKFLLFFLSLHFPYFIASKRENMFLCIWVLRMNSKVYHWLHNDWVLLIPNHHD